MRVLVWLVPIVVIVGVGHYLGFSSQRSGTVTMWLLLGLPTLALAALGAWRASRDGLLKAWMTPRWGDFTRGVAAAALLFGLAYVFARVAAPVGSPREVWLVSLYGQLGDPRQLQARWFAVAAGIVVAAASEEVLWRGYVTELLAERFGSRWAWLLAAVPYALAHVPTMWSLRGDAGLDPVLPLAALGAGAVWGAMARTFGRLTPGIVAHAMFDWVVVMMFPLWGPHG